MANESDKILSDLDKRLLLMELKSDYKLTMQKMKINWNILISVAIAVSSAFFALLNIFFSCTCNTNIPLWVYILYVILNCIYIISLCAYNIIDIFEKNIKKLKKFKSNVKEEEKINHKSIDEQICFYEDKTRDLKNKKCIIKMLLLSLLFVAIAVIINIPFYIIAIIVR